MRVNQVQQRGRDFGKLVVDLQVDASGEKRKGFQQPFGMRVLAAVRLEHQAGGDLRVALGELCSHLPQESQLLLVIVEQVFTHAPYFTSYCPLVTSRTVL